MFLILRNRRYVDRAKFCAVLGIRLSVKRYLLTLGKRFEAFDLNCGEVHEHIVTAVVVGNEAIALFRIEPLYCTVIHDRVPP